MKKRNSWIHCCLILLTCAGVVFVAPVSIQSQTPQTPAAQSPTAMPPDQDRDDVTRQQLASFDAFLDSHPEVAEQLRKDPSLVDKPEFVDAHPELKVYLEAHPEIRQDITQNPNAFMREAERSNRPDITQTELVNMDRFMDSHPEIAEQLRKDPSLVDNKQFVESHPALQQFLADHPGVREEYKQHPEAFMHDEERFDRREDRDRPDITRTELVNMNRFMESHPEIAEQLRKDPSLVDNKQFVQNHPALQQFLADHPGVREEYKQHPEAFMRDEDRFDRHEDRGRDNDAMRGELASFGQFLGTHNRIADELSRNPSLADNKEYLENHSELRDYLNAHPQVHEQLSANPGGFINAAQQFDTHSTPKVAGEVKPK
jgi:phage-related protein